MSSSAQLIHCLSFIILSPLNGPVKMSPYEAGDIHLSQKELQRMAVISSCIKGELACARAAELLDLMPGQISPTPKSLAHRSSRLGSYLLLSSRTLGQQRQRCALGWSPLANFPPAKTFQFCRRQSAALRITRRKDCDLLWRN